MAKVKFAAACAALLLALWFLLRPQAPSPAELSTVRPGVVPSDPLAPAEPVETSGTAGRATAADPTQQ